MTRASTSKGGDLLSHFDEIDESQNEIGISSLKYLPINNHDIAAKRRKN